MVKYIIKTLLFGFGFGSGLGRQVLWPWAITGFVLLKFLPAHLCFNWTCVYFLALLVFGSGYSMYAYDDYSLWDEVGV